MNKWIPFCLLCFFSFEAKSQSIDYYTADLIATQIPDSLTYSTNDIAYYIGSKMRSPEKRLRSVFTWITSTIRYNTENIYPLNRNNYSRERIVSTLLYRKGICFDFAFLFKDLSEKLGIKTFIVYGYTKRGRRISTTPHAWCISLIDSSWYMTDPTWGAGYVQDSRFVHKANENYFLVDPEKFIRTHIPFDPIWQCLNYPVTKSDFKSRIPKAKKETLFFDYKDSIKVYEAHTEIQQLTHAIRRIENNGITCYLDYDQLHHYKIDLDRILEKQRKEHFFTAIKHYNKAIFLFNEYTDYKNKYYLPYKSDQEIEEQLNQIDTVLNTSLTSLNLIKSPDNILATNIKQLKDLLEQAFSDLKFQKSHLEKYLKTAKQYRENLSRDTGKY